MNPLQLPPPQKKIIELLAKKERSLTELSKSLEMSKSGVLKHLDKLMSSDMIKKQMVTNEKGRESVYSLKNTSYFLSLNPDNDSIIEFTTHFTFELKYLLAEQVPQQNIREEIKILLKNLKDIPFTIIYGSAAKGESTWKSDIDILFLNDIWSDQDKEDIQDEISEINMELDHQVKPIFKTFSEFKEQSSLINEIKTEGIIIYGDIFTRHEVWKVMKRYRNFTD